MFVREKTSPDLIALGVLVIIAALGLVPTGDVLAVFGNPAPITVAAMFVLSAALVRCGALDGLSAGLDHAAHFSYRSVIFLLVVLVAFVSAWINNTPVVVVFVPVVITLARRMSLPASKFLIPLSYAAVLGGTCTLIGTSTNLVVNGILAQRGIPEMGMFELTWIGVPATLVAPSGVASDGTGGVYVTEGSPNGNRIRRSILLPCPPGFACPAVNVAPTPCAAGSVAPAGGVWHGLSVASQ